MEDTTIGNRTGIGTRIIGAARKVPDFVVSNDDVAKLVDTSDEWIVSRTGIKERHISRAGESVSVLAADVFRQLCENAGMTPDDIELLIVTTVTPEYLTPQSSAFVLGEVGACNAFAIDINAACTGFVYAISVADKILRSGAYKNAIIIGSDTLSKVTDWSDRSTCVLFGDGAGGVLMVADSSEQAESCVITEDLHTLGEHAMKLRGGKIPLSNAWHKDESPAEPYIIMEGRGIYDFVIKEVPKSIRKVTEDAGLTMDDVRWVVCHQSNGRIIEMLAKKLGLGMDKFFVSINRFGNTSSSTIPIAVSVMMEDGLLERGDKVIFAGFGAGLTWGTVLVQI